METGGDSSLNSEPVRRHKVQHYALMCFLSSLGTLWPSAISVLLHPYHNCCVQSSSRKSRKWKLLLNLQFCLPGTVKSPSEFCDMTHSCKCLFILCVWNNYSMSGSRWDSVLVSVPRIRMEIQYWSQGQACFSGKCHQRLCSWLRI